MAKQVQLLRGTTAQNGAFTGEEGALTYDTDKKKLRVHDGSTLGGFVVGGGFPDYSAGTSLTFTDLNTATEAGFFEIQGEAYNGTQLTIELNGVSKKIVQSNNNYYSTWGFAIIPVSAGDTVKGTSSYNSSGTITFYPCKYSK